MTKIAEIVDKILHRANNAPGNSIPYKIIDGRIHQIPDEQNLRFLHLEPDSSDIVNEVKKRGAPESTTVPIGIFDLILIDNSTNIPNSLNQIKSLLSTWGKVFLRVNGSYTKKNLLELRSSLWSLGFITIEEQIESSFVDYVLIVIGKYDRPWKGETGNYTVLLYCQHGFGDIIQYIRFAPLIKSRVNRVVLETRYQIAGLCESCRGIDEVIVKGNVLPHYDFSCDLFNVGNLLKFPTDIPYIQSKKHVILSADKLKIGITWCGHHLDKANETRSCDPNLFLKLQNNKIQFYSFQKFTTGKKQLPPNIAIDLSENIRCWEDTAAYLSNMDLVIAIDSSVAHLSGAMGKKTFVLLPKEWYRSWAPKGAKISPWYPDMRIFRQFEAENWTSLFSEINTMLYGMTLY